MLWKGELEKINEQLYVYRGAVNTGVLVSGNKALLFDCCDSLTGDLLQNIGVKRVEVILLTQCRRPSCGGAYRFAREGVEICAPEVDRHLIERPREYWKDSRNRWHLYHHRPQQVPAMPLHVSGGLSGGDSFKWKGFTIEVLDTPGPTEGSISYAIELYGKRYCFCGSIIFEGGRLPDLYSFQKGEAAGGCFRISDYHGFMGARSELLVSLKKVRRENFHVLIPSAGPVIADPKKDIDLLLSRIDRLMRNYASITSLNYYFPRLFEKYKDDPMRMQPARTVPMPSFIRSVGGTTSKVVVSENGAMLLIDAGQKQVKDGLEELIRSGAGKILDACWISHYHDDHVDQLDVIYREYCRNMISSPSVAKVVSNPDAYFLPCISPVRVPVKGIPDGTSWVWNEFTLTAYEFPGQTLYGAGLLVEGQGCRVFFSNDSGAPTGIDDHCCPNRIFIREGKGFRYCIGLWEKLNPDMIINQHQKLGISFSSEQLEYMKKTLEERETLLSDLIPLPSPDFGMDENFIRPYPYEQKRNRGGCAVIAMELTNHDARPAEVQVEPVLPPGWNTEGYFAVTVPPLTDGTAFGFEIRPDASVPMEIRIPGDEVPGLYVIPVRILWNGRYLGQIAAAIVEVGDFGPAGV